MDSSVLCSFKIGKPKCTSESTCPATSNTAHSVHKTSRGGKHPLFCQELTPMQNQRANIFISAKQLLHGNSATEQQKKNLRVLHHRGDESVPLGRIPHPQRPMLFTFLFEVPVSQRQKSHYPSLSILAWKYF